MDRRRFLVGTLGAGTLTLAGSWVATAGAATDDELAYANFGVAGELLLADFYASALDAKVAPAVSRGVLRRGRAAARQHARALTDLLVGAGDTAPAAEDFAFEWPNRTFASAASVRRTGVGVLRPLLGAYQGALAAVSEPSHRVLYASLAASVGQQLGALGAPVSLESFPVALDLEAASAALEAYLG